MAYQSELLLSPRFCSDLCSQIITIDEAKRRQSFSSCDGELPAEALLPLLSDPSDLLQDTHMEKVFFFLYIYT